MRLLAIDFGTSNTVAALSVDGQAQRTVTFDASPLLPSAVFVGADGQISTGREALRQARLDPTRFEPNPKRRIDDGEVLLGDRVVPVVDLVAAVLRTVAGEVRRQLGGAAPDEVRLTHPAEWGASRQNVLVTAARAAGLGTNLVLLPEPVAAAAQFTQLPGRALPPGGSVAIYDLGGGTFDVAVVGRTVGRTSGQSADSSGGESQFHVLAEGGLPDLGGLDFDQAILDHVGRGASVADPGRWQMLQRPTDGAGRRAARALAEDVRAAKETLSRYPQTDVALPEPFTDAHLTRPEFDALIRPDLLRSVDVLAATLQAAGVTPQTLTGVFLVGGSSRIPLVAGVIQQRLGITATALDQPETAVVLGALLVPLGRDGNRTVAAAGFGGGGPGAGGHPAGPLTGPASAPLRSDPVPTPGAGAPPKRRTAAMVAAAVAALLVAGTVTVVLLTRGDDPSGVAQTTGTVTSGGPSAVWLRHHRRVDDRADRFRRSHQWARPGRPARRRRERLHGQLLRQGHPVHRQHRRVQRGGGGALPG